MRAAVVLEQLWHRVPGGTGVSALEQVAAVAARGDVAQIGVAARHSAPPADHWRPAIEVRHLTLPRLALYEAWHRFRRPVVDRVAGPVDVIHATGYAMPPRSRPLVATIHDLAWRHDAGNFTRQGVRFFEAALRCVRGDADLVLCPSHATLEDCADAGIERERLRHVPWGIRAQQPSDADAASVTARLGVNGRYVLFVGTLEPRKNLRRLLEAFGKLPQRDVTLVVVGPEGWGDALGPRSEALGERVKLAGFVPNGQLGSLYRGAAAVCYPSLLEGYGLPVAEAMAYGAPIVTSSGTATEELVAGGAGLAVDPRDVDAIASALSAVLDDGDLAARLGATARERAAQRTWEATAAATVAAYREVAS